MDSLIKSNDSAVTPVFKDITDVAVDNGYADQKVAFWALNESQELYIHVVSYPSRAQIGAVNITMSMTGDSAGAGVYLVDGEPWTVGKDVSEPEVIRGKRYAYSDLNALLVNHSLTVAGFGGSKVRISTGLPYSHFFNNGAPDTVFQEKVKKSLKVEVTSRSGRETSIISDHVIYPESAAAMIDYIVDHKTGELAVEIVNGVVVVDIGGNTTDITSISSSYEIDVEKSDSKEIGVLDVRDELKKLILKEFEIDRIRDAQLDSAIRNNTCQIFGKTENVKDLVDMAKRQVTKKLMNFVDGLIGDASDVDIILFVGGGAAVLESVISEYPHSHVPENPEAANARGMLINSTYINVLE
jgi:plasmid segregation protein ParM